MFAARTTPVVGQVLKCHTIVLSRVIDVAADRADVLSAGLLLGEINLGEDGGHGVVETHDTLGLQILIALWGVSAAIDGGMLADERPALGHSFQGSRYTTYRDI